MKKFINIFVVLILIVIFTMAFSFSACTDHENNNPANNVENSTPNKNDTPKDDTEDEKIKVNVIYISKSELTLGIEEKEQLFATISPSNATTTLQWSSSNSGVASVNNNGLVTAIGQGTAVVKVQSDNGIVAVCTVDVINKTGTVTGEVTWKYNQYIGNKPDTNSNVILISQKVKSLPDSLALLITSNLPNGVYVTKVTGTGKYTFNNIPIGKYNLIISSANTNENPDKVTGFTSWGDAFYLFSKEGQNRAILTAKIYKTRSTKIEVAFNETTSYSYDFGYTYI